MMVVEGYEDCQAVVEQVAKGWGARYKRSQVEYDDMLQECWIWVLLHPHKIEEWRQTDCFERMLAKSLQNECTSVGERAKADQSGMSRDDRLRDARDSAKATLDEIYDLDVIASVDAGGGKNDRPRRGGAFKSDVLRRAYLSLGSEDRQIIDGRHRDGVTNRSMAQGLGHTEQSMSSYYTRALDRLVKAAGGIDEPLTRDESAGPQFHGWSGRWSTSSRIGLDITIDDYAAGYDA